jgi:V-type H+-transporting ATPase subunit a
VKGEVPSGKKNNCLRIVSRFPVALYTVPENPIERRKLADGVEERIEELNVVLKRTEEHRLEVCVCVPLHTLH